MKRGSVAGFEVWIRFMVISFLLCGVVEVWVVMNGSVLWSGAAKPVRETGGAEQRIVARDQAPFLKRRSEVAGLLVRHDRAGVVMRREVLAHDLVKRDSVWACDLNGSIQRLGNGNFGQVSGEVVRKNGLKQHRGQVNGLSAGRLISDAPNEFKELRRAENRIRNRRCFDQFFLGHLRAQVSASDR